MSPESVCVIGKNRRNILILLSIVAAVHRKLLPRNILQLVLTLLLPPYNELLL